MFIFILPIASIFSTISSFVIQGLFILLFALGCICILIARERISQEKKLLSKLKKNHAGKSLETIKTDLFKSKGHNNHKNLHIYDWLSALTPIKDKDVSGTKVRMRPVPSIIELRDRAIRNEENKWYSIILRCLISNLVIVGIFCTMLNIPLLLKENDTTINSSDLATVLDGSLWAIGATIALLILRLHYVNYFQSYINELEIAISRLIPEEEHLLEKAWGKFDAFSTNIATVMTNLLSVSIGLKETFESTGLQNTIGQCNLAIRKMDDAIGGLTTCAKESQKINVSTINFLQNITEASKAMQTTELNWQENIVKANALLSGIEKKSEEEKAHLDVLAAETCRINSTLGDFGELISSNGVNIATVKTIVGDIENKQVRAQASTDKLAGTAQTLAAATNAIENITNTCVNHLKQFDGQLHQNAVSLSNLQTATATIQAGEIRIEKVANQISEHADALITSAEMNKTILKETQGYINQMSSNTPKIIENQQAINKQLCEIRENDIPNVEKALKPAIIVPLLKEYFKSLADTDRDTSVSSDN